MPKPGQYKEIIKRYPYSAPKVSKGQIFILVCGHAVLPPKAWKDSAKKAWCAICTREEPKVPAKAARSDHKLQAAIAESNLKVASLEAKVSALLEKLGEKTEEPKLNLNEFPEG